MTYPGLATAAGYDSVEAYVADVLGQLAEKERPEEFLPLSPEELAASLAMLEQGRREIAEGKGLTVEAARELSRKRLHTE